MDVEQARTFLAIVETGSFVEAAKRVFVTQSTVSMRVKVLEEQLGKALFERSKAGARLTPAGLQFHKHAQALVRVWEQARLEVSLPPGYDAALTVGASYSLWDGFLVSWVSRVRSRLPEIAVKTHVGFSEALMRRLVDGTLDVGVMYTPQSRPGFDVELLFEEELVLASSERRPRSFPGKNYIYIDWGPEFQADHTLNFPDLTTPGLHMELGSLGIAYVLENQASGYFPRRLVAPLVEEGRLSLVKGAPVFSYPVYAVLSEAADQRTLKRVTAIMRSIARDYA